MQTHPQHYKRHILSKQKAWKTYYALRSTFPRKSSHSWCWVHPNSDRCHLCRLDVKTTNFSILKMIKAYRIQPTDNITLVAEVVSYPVAEFSWSLYLGEKLKNFTCFQVLQWPTHWSSTRRHTEQIHRQNSGECQHIAHSKWDLMD